MTALWQDIRYGIRQLRKSPGFTSIALITLAIGIGANTIMFSISDLLLIQTPRKVKAREQLAVVSIKDLGYSDFRYSEYLTLRDSNLAFSDLMAEDAGLTGYFSNLAYGDWAREVRTRYVSADYFTGLGDNLVRGGGFLPEEERRGSAPVVVLSHPLWQQLGADPQIVGKYITINSTQCQVVGVAVKGFGGVTFDSPDLWLPLGSYWTVVHFDPGTKWGRARLLYLNIVGRLKPGVTLSTAQAQLQTLIPHFKRESPERWRERSSINLRPPGRIMIHGDIKAQLQEWTVTSGVLVAVSAIILAIACLNLANM
jgi:hypothetical protein